MDEYFQEKTVTIKQSDYDKMTDYLNRFAELVENLQQENEELKGKLNLSTINVNEALKKYEEVLKIND